MKIFCTGKFEPEYNRTRVILSGFEKLGVELKIYPYRKKKKADRALIRKYGEWADWIFLPSFTHTDVAFIKRITSKPLLFDPLISRYLSKVFDYQTIWRYSPRAYKNFLKDSISLHRADKILADTNEHKKYFQDKFGIKSSKIEVVPIGVIPEDFYPNPVEKENPGELIIGFYGSFIPLHGIDVILEAAGILHKEKDIIFHLIGDGILLDKMKKQAKSLKLNNVIFKGWKSYQDLGEEINRADIWLGIFGSSLKAKMVIPNKIYHYAACNKAIITGESKAINEIFEHGINIHTCEANASSLAESILKLGEKVYRDKIGKAAGTLVNSNFTDNAIAKKILNFLKS